jgi:FAD/FMN-containing dehydrogenase
VIETGTAANPQAETFFRYALGPDLTGLFIGAEGAYGIVTEATLRLYPYPEEIYLERFTCNDMATAVEIFRRIGTGNLACYISAPIIKPDYVLFDINIEGFRDEVELRKERIRRLIREYPGIEFRGSEAPAKFWDYRWYNTGVEFREGIAGAVNFFLPFSKLLEGLDAMREIMERHEIKNYVQQLFPGASASEVVALLFHFPGDAKEHAKIAGALKEMMDKAMLLGGAPYSKGRQWTPYLDKYMKNTGYLALARAIKETVDPNHVMNPGVAGL